MSAHFLPLLLLLLTNCGSTDATEPDPVESGQLVWEDNFDGDTLDLTKWTPLLGDGCDINLCGWGNNELQWYRSDNATVADGFLTITAQEQAVGGRAYTSSRIRTRLKGDWTYGRFEIRAKLPRGQGLWPAIWMMPTDDAYGTWAASGEIDIMEYLGHQPSVVHGTLHYGDRWPDNVSSSHDYRLSSGTFSDDFHTFVLEWEEGVMRWFVDDVLYATQTQWHTQGASFPAPFDRRFHLILNVAVGGNWPGSPDDTTTFPQQMVVDYVRVYAP